MINPEIISYIRSEREKQTPDSTIRANLLANGWTEADISEAFTAITNAGTPTARVSVPPTLQASAPGTTPLVSQMTAQSTPPFTSATQQKTTIIDKAVLAKYRRERMWIYFGTMAFLGIAYTSLVFLMSGSESFLGIFTGGAWTFIYLIPVLGAAYVASRAAFPHTETWKNVLDLIIGLIGTLVLSFVFGFIAVFAFCLIMIGSGGLRGL